MKNSLTFLLLNLFCLNAFCQNSNSKNLYTVPDSIKAIGFYAEVKMNEDAVKNIYVFNALGRKMKTFDVVRGEKYEISDLPNGLYFVQLVGRTNKILTTQRLTKKS